MSDIGIVRCVAKLSGDGCVSRRYIRYSNKDKDLLNEFIRDIKDEFGGITITEGIETSGTPFAQVQIKEVVYFFKKIHVGYYSDFITMPKFVIEGGINFKKEFIRAFYDDEGSPSLRLNKRTIEWKRNLTLCSNSKIILKQIKSILLNDFKIVTNKIIKNKKEDKCFVLGITGKDNFTLFKDLIGFKSKSKKDRINLIIKSYGNTYARNREGFNTILDKIAKNRKFYKV